MSEAPESAPGSDDPTRDIRRPPVPGRPPPVLPAASQFDQPTDQLGPHHRRPAEATLAFSAPVMGQRAVGQVQVGRSRRRWPLIVLAALPVLVIVVSGIWLLLLLRAA